MCRDPPNRTTNNHNSGVRKWKESGAESGGMHANVHHADRNEWRLPPDETLQVADPKAKKAEVGEEEVSTPILSS